ncbi:hypothetical protein [Croceibacter atlanticus]|jgi:hypothetical protein|uniref:Uncharacterized protein n=1 Tax=Croceibacter atlanticus (strain ATCC BAA-628 / JCM 21780 / CIP 108009 / IAM 15332 / KCTC 12090 / HTCC2559) TaxID=216432 RepID=A3U6L3_CROAH|nr:hypothetical protein [Croceibacter atlanticus]EAP87880.1 hypothetical protein CA2559_03955 [Croceibacter atlanticus HTCC2559]
MRNTNNNPLHKRQDKDKRFKAQLKQVYTALMAKPMTMKETDVYTGVMRENICRYIGTLREEGRIALVRKRKCTITGYNNVGEYTANPDLFPVSNQLKLPLC